MLHAIRYSPTLTKRSCAVSRVCDCLRFIRTEIAVSHRDAFCLRGSLSCSAGGSEASLDLIRWTFDVETRHPMFLRSAHRRSSFYKAIDSEGIDRADRNDLGI